MVWIDRDGGGMVNGVYAIRQYAGQEEVPDNHPDVQEFQQRQAVIMTKPQRDKAQLRQRIDAATTTDELKAILHDMLGAR